MPRSLATLASMPLPSVHRTASSARAGRITDARTTAPSVWRHGLAISSPQFQLRATRPTLSGIGPLARSGGSRKAPRTLETWLAAMQTCRHVRRSRVLVQGSGRLSGTGLRQLAPHCVQGAQAAGPVLTACASVAVPRLLTMFASDIPRCQSAQHNSQVPGGSGTGNKPSCPPQMSYARRLRYSVPNRETLSHEAAYPCEPAPRRTGLRCAVTQNSNSVV